MESETRTMDLGVEDRAGIVLLYCARHDEIPSAVPLTDELVIGREPPPGGLRLQQPAASRVHARIERRGAVWVVVDLDSRNGVLVNGRFVREKILSHRDDIRIGDALFEFRAEDVEPNAAHRIDGSGVGNDAIAPEIVGGHRMRTLAREVDPIARTSAPVLVIGESGTGKEVIARAVHRMSGRSGRFVVVSSVEIPGGLLDDRELDDSTIFFDEIADVPLDAQAKLVRVIETRPVRVVCATHRDLGKLVREDRFRADLHARIQGSSVTVPPLRERREDLYLLTRHLLGAAGRGDAAVSFRFMLALSRHGWPYNVRELAQAIQMATLRAGGGDLDEAHLPESVRESMKGYGGEDTEGSISSGSLRATAPTADELRAAMKEEQGNVSAVARRFKKDRTQINRWLRQHGISPDEFRG